MRIIYRERERNRTKLYGDKDEILACSVDQKLGIDGERETVKTYSDENKTLTPKKNEGERYYIHSICSIYDINCVECMTKDLLYREDGIGWLDISISFC